jgi:hypothetical protein
VRRIESGRTTAVVAGAGGRVGHRASQQRDFEQAIADVEPTTLDWLKTARTLVKYGGAASSYREVDKCLRREKLY